MAGTEFRPDAGRPREAPDAPVEECDLIMKGGITSGVAYPAAVLALSKRYQFRSIGGASAGAIAAAVTAAAQFARDDGGLERLSDVQELLKREGLLVSLFQPTREARPLLNLFLAVQAARSGWRRAVTFAARVLGRLLLPVAVVAAFVFAVLATLISAAGGGAATMTAGAWWLLGGTLLATAVAAGAVIGTLRILGLLRGLPASYHGMCLGMAEGRSTEPALTEWLHTQIQRVAGLPDHEPLTFERLEKRDRNAVTLRMMTTDLTLARPVRYPLPADHGYLFSPDEWRSFFPPDLLAHLERDDVAPVAHEGGDDVPRLRRLPADKLPILVATRMSLAFPVLLAAVPVWQLDREGNPVRHWMSDGGISSNFPIHFFDAWLPRRPTFGLNLVPEPRTDRKPTSATDAVETYTASEKPPARRARIEHTPGVLAQILDTMQNWRDTLQSELPGFRDRIAHIRLEGAEGGMNITMPPDVIERVDEKGRAAGEELTAFQFRAHWLTRYLGLMREIETRLGGDRGSPLSTGVRTAFTEELATWLASGAADAECGLTFGSAWYAEATDATKALLKSSEEWLPSGRSFAVGDAPDPPPVMRMTPDV